MSDYAADQNLRMAQKMLEQQGEINRLKAKLAEYEGDDRHVIEFRTDGWTIMHPIACRPDLFGCALNRVGEDLDGPPAAGPGRYHCELDHDGRLVIDYPALGGAS